jgi:Uma2 family endonuclease
MLAIAVPEILHEGDRMDVGEFLDRWSAMPGLKFAELLGGTVFLMPSPVYRQHSDPEDQAGLWLSYYRQNTPGTHSGRNTTWKFNGRNAPQPDLFLRVLPSLGGQSRTEGDYPAGAPELIIEVVHTSTSRDLGIKLNLYRESGVKEYITVHTFDNSLTWRILRNGIYEPLAPSHDGTLRSETFPGLWIDPPSLWQGNPLDTLHLGLASPEHKAFLTHLNP